MRHGRDGRMLLGGTKSVLHRPKPTKKLWSQEKDGDLWELFAKLIRQKGSQQCYHHEGKGPRNGGNGATRQSEAGGEKRQ